MELGLANCCLNLTIIVKLRQQLATTLPSVRILEDNSQLSASWFTGLKLVCAIMIIDLYGRL